VVDDGTVITPNDRYNTRMERVRIEGERVTLRPMRLDELDASIAAREAAPAGAIAGPVDREKLRARIERSGLLVDGKIDLAIEVDGTRIGEIQTYVTPEHELPPGAYEIGIGIDDSSLRGHGYGREAVELLTDWLFRDAGAARVHILTVESNSAMRAVAERLGFTEDGVRTDHGQEYVFYAVTRDAWRAARRSR
jgi:RimJ/RimL family protein N-acetyltransferase